MMEVEYVVYREEMVRESYSSCRDAIKSARLLNEATVLEVVRDGGKKTITQVWPMLSEGIVVG